MKLTSRLMLAGAMLAAFPAQAAIFWSNFDVGTVVDRTTGGAWPRVERNPLAPYDNGSVNVGVDTQWFYRPSFDFTVNTSFVANRAIMALRFAGSFGAQRIVFGISELNPTTSQFVSLGSLQVQANSLRPAVYEVDSAFGTNGTSLEALFEFQPISFTAGNTYRITGGHATGAGGVTNWMYSDVAAPTGTARLLEYRTGASQTTQLAFQPTLALTDGGDLVPVPVPGIGGVPEPESWALMILGFGLVGTTLRRRRESAQPPVPA